MNFTYDFSIYSFMQFVKIITPANLRVPGIVCLTVMQFVKIVTPANLREIIVCLALC